MRTATRSALTLFTAFATPLAVGGAIFTAYDYMTAPAPETCRVLAYVGQDVYVAGQGDTVEGALEGAVYPVGWREIAIVCKKGI